MKINKSQKNTNVDIEDIDAKTAEALISNIHEKLFFNMKVYCRGLKNLVTPTKSNPVVEPAEEVNITPTKDDTANETVKANTTPMPPGLSKEEFARAAKKARQLKNKQDKLTKTKKTKDPNISSSSDDFLSTAGFVFDDVNTHSKNPGSKFFESSPVSPNSKLTFLATGSNPTVSEKMIQKEEIWLSQVTPNPITLKRQSSPNGDLERRIRSRSESFRDPLSRIPLVAKAL